MTRRYRPVLALCLAASLCLVFVRAPEAGYEYQAFSGACCYPARDEIPGTERIDEDTLRTMAQAVEQMDDLLRTMASALGRVTNQAEAEDMAKIMTEMSVAMRDMSLQLQCGRIDPWRMKYLNDSLSGMTMWADSL